MDIAQDSTEIRVCAIECPLCKKRFVKPIVFNTHLLAHINYHNKHWPGLFACTLCEFAHADIAQVSTHIEKLHAVKYRVDSAVADQLLADNDREKKPIHPALRQTPPWEPFVITI